jgi:pilus assembly protein CpaB
MRQRLAIGAAVGLAIIGTLLLISYVRGAEQRAREGQELATVLVVDQPIERGTLAAEVADLVRQVDVPVEVIASNAVFDLAQLEGLVATVDLVPGEQVIASRFRHPSALTTETRVEVPPEFLQVTVALEPDRAVGGRLVPGDRVAFFASFNPFQLSAVEPGDLEALEEARESIVVVGGTEEQPSTVGVQTPNSTHIVIHKVLITGVQVEEAPRTTADDSTPVEYAPTGNLLITLAATAEDTERIVFTAEHGSVWLALEDSDAPTPVTDIRTRGNIYR